MSDFEIKNGVLTIPGKLKEISSYNLGPVNFKGRESLEKLVIKEGIYKIWGDGYFSNCRNLTEVVLPESLEYITQNTFKNTPWREKHTEEENGCFYLGRFLIDSDKDIVAADIREGTVMICGLAFKGRKNLVRVQIPESVKTIGCQAFTGCEKLEELSFPGNGLEQIEDSAFTGCTSLRTIDIPDSCKHISQIAFVSNTGKIMLTPQKAYIPNINLNDCNAIQKEFYTMCYLSCFERHSAEMQASYLAYIKKNKLKYLNHLIDTANIETLNYLADETISKANIDNLIEYALAGDHPEATAFLMDWKKTHIKESKKKKDPLMAELEKNPFSAAELKKSWNTKKLPDGTLCITSYKGTETEIIVPAQIGKAAITSIGREAFNASEYGRASAEQVELRKKITSVTIPNGIKSIEFLAFYCCESLGCIRIPESVSEIDSFAFDGDQKLVIHAPAGSYAEQYAKEKRIPFVAEEE